GDDRREGLEPEGRRRADAAPDHAARARDRAGGGLMLQPKRLKHRKFQRGRMKGSAQSGNTITKGDYALMALEPCWMTARQIEAARRAIVHHFKRGGKVWINVFPDKPVTKKRAEVRMGSGKGSPDHWVSVRRPGRILCDRG